MGRHRLIAELCLIVLLLALTIIPLTLLIGAMLP